PGGRAAPPRRPGGRRGGGRGPGRRRNPPVPSMPARHTVPNPPSHPSSRAYPAGVAGNSRTPGSPPTGPSAAATCTPAWVSTPPVMARAWVGVSTMVTVIPFPVPGLRDGTHPLAARTCEPRPLTQARQIRPAAPVGTLRLGPGRQLVRRTTRMAPADSQVRPDPGPTLRPHHRTTPEAGPE